MSKATRQKMVAKELLDIRIREHQIHLLAGNVSAAHRARDEALSHFYELISAQEAEINALNDTLRRGK